MVRKEFPNLKTQAYQHPFDRKALMALERTPVLPKLLKKVNEYGIDRLLRMQTMGTEFKVTPNNFPRLENAFVETCNILDIAPIPDLYLFTAMGSIKTYAMGVEKPVVGINVEGMEWLSDDELLFIFGHQVSRIQGNYLRYQQIATVIPLLKNLIASTTLGLGGLAANGVEIALYNWITMAKFTGDRAGLLACQDIDVAIRALMKWGGLPNSYLNQNTIDDFMIQARKFEANYLGGLDGLTKTFSFMEHQLSWTVMRASELLKWVDSGEYENLLSGQNIENKQIETEESDDDEEWDFLNVWDE
ncbi:M48 family metallopeptidase [Aetokthonos hydrillicola Thurmond2011]|jgi:hypothetical protein|uniref:M48 family metallopeptidase n=1 Tax=Aetokthonos hydrillicola Thurmond2011 TaxID=2712845 RepID=A0AAP5M7Q5_9CYAN|nr:M48 family metallopeptidase [Aetokthonos hydrillicola]MBO3457337.1 M48 family metallopeptidase [Aetokthonos hydrillicola CCALA 1050]MBW4586686.1 M48 family metallopeptidase [Aetokthonos hydrillicola CCALA 1050]MDR9893987.1 M48 family metallopeptidase [Aetokthonos hydrillicola Thurmond2011]